MKQLQQRQGLLYCTSTIMIFLLCVYMLKLQQQQNNSHIHVNVNNTFGKKKTFLVCFVGLCPEFCRVPQISLRSLCPRERDQFQKQGCHPDVKAMPAASKALFSDIRSHTDSIINLVELCHYIMEYGLTITTPGQICHQFVSFPSPSEYPWCSGESKRRYRLIR